MSDFAFWASIVISYLALLGAMLVLRPVRLDDFLSAFFLTPFRLRWGMAYWTDTGRSTRRAGYVLTYFLLPMIVAAAAVLLADHFLMSV